ncbi:MAG: winged helix-turn-helix transcriptional regulator [Planctomycetaceae bacterium]|nr:winged helix-turn-helix transcriptional regulator [Planctomycetaceae bacterium]
MFLKGQDIIASLQLFLGVGPRWTYAELARKLGLSVGGANMAVRRARDAGLLMGDPDGGDKPVARRQALLAFLEHGVATAFHTSPGAVVRGLPTAHSAPPLLGSIHTPSSELPLVWPDAEGTVRGRSVEPLYRSAPGIARRDPEMYELLALVDSVRCGAARERTLAVEHLRQRLLHASAK